MPLMHGDCLKLLKTLKNSCVDLVLIDPPYNIGYTEWDSFLDIPEVTKDLYRVLKPNGSIFCFCGWSFVCNLQELFYKQFKLNDWIIYDRIKGRGAKKRLVSTREDILWYVKSNKWTFNKDVAYSTIKKKTKGMGLKNGRETRALSNVWTDISPIVPWSKERVAHPTQKPVSLMKRIVEVFSNPQDTVLDCFMGSGTTGVACKELDRGFIGIELNKEYFKMAEQRIRDVK